MKVTVLIAVHNGGAYLRDAVGSVLAQTFTDLELLLVDDASTDGAFGALPPDERIRVLRNDRNLGQVPSLNRGLLEAQGEYIARLDADDLMLPTRLDRQVAVLDAEPQVALVGTWLDVVDERGRRWGTVRGHMETYADFVIAILTDRIPFGHPSITFRRDVVQALGGYEASLAPSEDKDLYRRLALGRHEARVVAAPLVRYRRHNAQLSQVHMARQLANDHTGQERFLTALAPELPARSVRLLLSGDAEFWTSTPLDELESLLDGATERLELSAEERNTVGRSIARRCVRTLTAAWSVPGTADATHARAATAFAAAHGSAAVQASLAIQPAIRLTRPAGALLGSTRVHARRALRRSARLAQVRKLARRSRLLRRVYTTLFGFRLLDDDVDGRERADVP